MTPRTVCAECGSKKVKLVRKIHKKTPGESVLRWPLLKFHCKDCGADFTNES